MTISPEDVHASLAKAILVEGYPIVLDLERSQGQWLYDSKSDRTYLDFFTFYASRPVAFNHPRLRDPEYVNRLLLAARHKPSNGDVYTQLFADFVEAFRTRALGPGMKYLFFVDGGALAVENALKAAFDWKTRKNMAAGRSMKDLQVIHFEQAFHGRSGYTLSLTNTSDPRKTQYFPKFPWPRIVSPAVIHPLDKNLAQVVELEARALRAIDEAYAKHGQENIAAIIIEPIQSEGGDRYFRPEFFRALRNICDQRETILIFDEVQTGIGTTGTMWFYQQLDIRPDVVAFAKKAQTGGIMGSARFDEVDSVFKVKSRISSTFGGNLVDFVRCQQYLDIIHKEDLLTRIKHEGAFLKSRVHEMSARDSRVTNVRGQAAALAFDVPTQEQRDAIVREALHQGLIILPCGDHSIRLRPALDLTRDDAGTGMDMLDRAVNVVLGK